MKWLLWLFGIAIVLEALLAAFPTFLMDTRTSYAGESLAERLMFLVFLVIVWLFLAFIHWVL